jgi:hypothetical protein
LFCGQQVHEAQAEVVEVVSIFNVLVQGGGVELREYKHAPDAGVEAVGNGDVYEAIFAGNRHGGFGSLLSKREESGAGSSSEDEAYHFDYHGCFFYGPGPFVFSAFFLFHFSGLMPEPAWEKSA